MKRLLGRDLGVPTGEPGWSCFKYNTKPLVLLVIESMTHQVPLSVPLNISLAMSLYYLRPLLLDFNRGETESIHKRVKNEL